MSGFITGNQSEISNVLYQPIREYYLVTELLEERRYVHVMCALPRHLHVHWQQQILSPDVEIVLVEDKLHTLVLFG